MNYWRDGRYAGPRANWERREGHLYVARLPALVDDRGVMHLVKVGHTKEPDHRMYLLAGRVHKALLRIADVWMSGPHQDHAATERELLQWCREQTGQTRGEFFADLPYESVVAQAERVMQSRLAQAGGR